MTHTTNLFRRLLQAGINSAASNSCAAEDRCFYWLLTALQQCKNIAGSSIARNSRKAWQRRLELLYWTKAAARTPSEALEQVIAEKLAGAGRS